MNDSIIENMINISLNAGYMIANNSIEINDNKKFCDTAQKLAKKFENQYNKENDYIDSIDTFSEIELSNLYKHQS